MADLNFGLLDTTLPARIAAIPQEAQKQQSANMLQAMQTQGAMQQNEMSQMQLAEMKADRAEMVKLQQDLAAKGGSPDLGQYADMLMRSPKHMKLGIELKQKLDQQAQFARIMGDAPAAAPEPGAFGAGAAAVPAQAQNNALAPAAPPVNAFAAGGDKVAALQRKRNALLSLGTPQAIAAARALDADIALAAKEPTYQNVPGVGLVNPRDRSVVMASVEPTDPIIKQYKFAVDQGFNGSILDYKERIARAGAPSNITKVNTYLPASEEAQRDFIKSTRVTYDALKQSPAMFANIEEAKKLIPAASVFMGTGGEGMKAAASFLNNRLGMSINTEGVKTAEELRSRLFQGILANLKKLDSQPSERQQAALEQALGNLNTDPNALSNVLDSYADTVRNNIDTHNAEVKSAIDRGIKFPYDPIIKVPAKATKPDVYVRDANGVIRKQ